MATGNNDEQKELFTEFFHRHVTQIRAFTRARTPNSSDVEDICADAFALAWTHIDELCDLSDAQAHRWLQRVIEFRIKRTSRDFIRQSRAIQRISKEIAKSSDSSESLVMNGLDEISEQAAASLVSGTLEQLSPDHQEILRWNIYENLKSPAIAKRLNCTPTAARLRLMRARRAFAEKFSEVSNPFSKQVAQ